MSKLEQLEKNVVDAKDAAYDAAYAAYDDADAAYDDWVEARLELSDYLKEQDK